MGSLSSSSRLPVLLRFVGIFVVLSKEIKYSRLAPFYLGNSWVGSLRHDIKFLIDEPAQVEKNITQILEDKECYYKYVVIQNLDDLKDIYMYYKYIYKDVLFMEENLTEESGRYTNVFVKEYNIK